MPFELPEYDLAFRSFFGEATHEVAAASSPLLSEIPFEQTEGPVGSVIQDQEGKDVELTSEPVLADYKMSIDAVRDGDLEALVMQIVAVADQLGSAISKGLFETMDTVTKATGNVFDAGGKLTIDAILDGLEKIEIGLKDDGTLSMPTVHLSPEQFEKLPPITEEQRDRLARFEEEKLKELRARRRNRRLS